MPDTVTAPSLVGLDAYTAVVTATNAGFNVELAGITQNHLSTTYTVTAQSLPSGAKVERGTVIRITVLKTDFED